ncbi:MAG: hypothetical protein H6868_08945 [Rhodospirillales bacterium]|nr:hypothetical protein [Rhodospirillales bacterium]
MMGKFFWAPESLRDAFGFAGWDKKIKLVEPPYDPNQRITIDERVHPLGGITEHRIESNEVTQTFDSNASRKGGVFDDVKNLLTNKTVTIGLTAPVSGAENEEDKGLKLLIAFRKARFSAEYKPAAIKLNNLTWWAGTDSAAFEPKAKQVMSFVKAASAAADQGQAPTREMVKNLRNAIDEKEETILDMFIEMAAFYDKMQGLTGDTKSGVQSNVATAYLLKKNP